MPITHLKKIKSDTLCNFFIFSKHCICKKVFFLVAPHSTKYGDITTSWSWHFTTHCPMSANDFIWSANGSALAPRHLAEWYVLPLPKWVCVYTHTLNYVWGLCFLDYIYKLLMESMLITICLIYETLCSHLYCVCDQCEYPFFNIEILIQ